MAPEAISEGLKPSKYHSVKTPAGGFIFDSGHEAARYLELALLQAAGLITGLELQPKFDIHVIPLAGGEPIWCGSLKADFRYVEKGQTVIEDAKSKPTKTQQYRLRKRLVEALYGVTIREV